MDRSMPDFPVLHYLSERLKKEHLKKKKKVMEKIEKHKLDEMGALNMK